MGFFCTSRVCSILKGSLSATLKEPTCWAQGFLWYQRVAPRRSRNRLNEYCFGSTVVSLAFQTKHMGRQQEQPWFLPPNLGLMLVSCCADVLLLLALVILVGSTWCHGVVVRGRNTPPLLAIRILVGSFSRYGGIPYFETQPSVFRHMKGNTIRWSVGWSVSVTNRSEGSISERFLYKRGFVAMGVVL